MNRSNCLWCCGIMGVCLTILGTILLPLLGPGVSKILAKELELTEGTSGWESFIFTPIPVYFQIWVWNLTNPEHFLNGEKPHLEQRGPYTYRLIMFKENLVENDNYTVSYTSPTGYVYVDDMSVGPSSEVFTTVNVVAFTAAALARSFGNSTDDRVHQALHLLSDAKILMTVSVDGFMWGYEDPYLKYINDLTNVSLPTKFGVFIGSNMTSDSVWTVNTGGDDIAKLNIIDNVNGKSSLDYWRTDYANMINGSDGTFMHPELDAEKDNRVYIYVGIICRAAHLDYESKYKRDGILFYRYNVTEYLLAHPSINPDNADFCDIAGNCPPSGLINLTVCNYGAPLFGSLPHFLYGDKELTVNVSGMNPNEEEHRVYLDKDPLTGATMIIQVRAQLNFKVEKYDHLKETQYLKETYLPVVWLNESCDLDDEFVKYYKTSVLLPLNFALALFITILVIGCGLLFGTLITVYKDYRERKNPKKHKPTNMKEVHEKPQLERFTSQTPLENDFTDIVNDKPQTTL
ncbi:platelet glycoprotein 4-like [Antedon mediterranea]|uniref:platelet glycoprotein 4-like n=1 Tax=Antedon mediterranea TaxID=105859 RepID=UPI003AF41EB9